MRSIQKSIKEDKFPEFIHEFFRILHPDGTYPEWALEALNKVNVHLNNCDIQNGSKVALSEEIKS
jgi:queuine tRNA-ribosyltransferase